MKSPPVVLTIAGSDNSAGAGIQADLKTFSTLGVYGLTAVTCVVAEVPGKVSAIQPVNPKIVREQIRLSFAAYPVAAVKTGMLFSREIIEVVCEELGRRNVPLVVDPVMFATSGASLLEADAITLFRERLFTLATVVTPNLHEVCGLLGRTVTNLEEMRHAGEELAREFETAFLLKGGHLPGANAIDLFFEKGNVTEFSAPFVKDVSTHGTGCTYSAAITAGLAQGLDLRAAVAAAKQFVTRAITDFFRWSGTDALNHFA